MENLPLQRGDAVGLPFSIELLLVLLLAAVVVAAFVLQRRRGGPLGRLLAGWATSAPGTLEVVRAVRLTPGASLHVVRWDNEELLLSCTAAEVSVLSRRQNTVPPAPVEAKP